MRQVLAFLEWEARCWEERATECIQALALSAAVDPLITTAPTIPVIPEGALDEGLQAYALCQAAIRRKLFTRFSTQWNSVPTFIRILNSALAEPGVQGKPSYLTPASPIALL